MLTAQDVRDARFARTRFRDGYDVEQVDALLDRVVATLDALAAGRPGTLTARDVEASRFEATKFREGYDQDAVDDFLDRVVEALAAAPADLSAEAAAPRTLLEAHAADRAARSLDAAALRAAVPPVVRRGPGYARAEVDAFVERAARALEDARHGRTPGVSAQDVHAVRFAEAGWRAERYDEEAVDLLLDRVAAALGG